MKNQTQHYIVHYGELSLKGNNRYKFEQRLIHNIQTALADVGEIELHKFHSYFIVEVAGDAPTEILERRLQRVFGIAYVAPTVIVPPQMDAIMETALDLAAGVITPQTTFAVDTRRGDKQFPVTSPEVNNRVGAAIVAATQAPVRLNDPDVILEIQIYEQGAYLFIRRLQGAGGLPIGASGRVLALFSGGIDSPVAAHMMHKRGCNVDFLHFHLLPNAQQARDSKIVAMARALLAPHRLSAPLYLASSELFEATISTYDTALATVVFRRFMMRVAERIAWQRNAVALVTGESVGQVASQTLKNIDVISRAAERAILRPLVSFDKQEIVNIAQEIGTFDLSIQPYQDPCSLHASRPDTWANLGEVEALEEKLDIDALVERTLAEYIDEVWIRF
ncbi:MAG: tRNA uracil 4-sulfurtransferase ThiI [Anaerolineales bacterium]